MFASDISIGKDVQISGRNNISIGGGSCIGNDVWLNVCVQDDEIRMKIGKCVLIGRQGFVSTGGYLEIADYCLFAPRVAVSDADHVFSDPTQPIIQQGATLGRTLIIEENCWLGVNCVVLGNITIGRGSVVAANSAVLTDVPPFCVVAGTPAKILKMYNFKTKLWERVRNEEEIQQILDVNNKIGLPNREEYQKMLARKSTVSKIDSRNGGIEASSQNFFSWLSLRRG